MNTRILLTLLTSGVVLFSACSQPASLNKHQAANDEPFSAVTIPTTAPEAGCVYTADENSNSVSVIDLASGHVKAVPIHITPHNVQVSMDGRTASS